MGFKEVHKEKRKIHYGGIIGSVCYSLMMFWLEIIIFLEVGSIQQLPKNDPHILEF